MTARLPLRRMDCVSALTLDAYQLINNKEFLVTALLVISSAFDNIDLYRLHHLLTTLHIPFHFITYIINLFPFGKTLLTFKVTV